MNAQDTAQDTAQRRNAFAEIKVMLAPAALASLLGVVHQRPDDALERTIVLFDTPDLALMAAGITLRVRRRLPGETEATVKIHHMREADVAASPERHAGFKCETDVTGEHHVSTCSFSTKSPSVAGDAAFRDDGAAVSRLFSTSQHHFLTRSGLTRLSRDVTWPMLGEFGPITAREWKTPAPYEHSLTLDIEHWQLADGTRFLELSVRVPEQEADAQQQRLLQWVGRAKLPMAPHQNGKTAAALRALTGQRVP